MSGQQMDKSAEAAIALLNKFCETECDGFMKRCSSCTTIEPARQLLAVARTKSTNAKG